MNYQVPQISKFETEYRNLKADVKNTLLSLSTNDQTFKIVSRLKDDFEKFCIAEKSFKKDDIDSVERSKSEYVNKAKRGKEQINNCFDKPLSDVESLIRRIQAYLKNDPDRDEINKNIKWGKEHIRELKERLKALRNKDTKNFHTSRIGNHLKYLENTKRNIKDEENRQCLTHENRLDKLINKSQKIHNDLLRARNEDPYIIEFFRLEKEHLEKINKSLKKTDIEAQKEALKEEKTKELKKQEAQEKKEEEQEIRKIKAEKERIIEADKMRFQNQLEIEKIQEEAKLEKLRHKNRLEEIALNEEIELKKLRLERDIEELKVLRAREDRKHVTSTIDGMKGIVNKGDSNG